MAMRPQQDDDGRSDYIQLAFGGKVAGELLRNLGNAVGGAPGVMAGLVGKLIRRREGKPKPKTASRPVTSSRTAQSVARQVRPKQVNRGGIGSGQSAGAKRAIVEGIERDYPGR